MPGLYPFKELVKRPAGDKGVFVRVAGFYRRMKAMFSDFELTATGAVWSNKGPNGLHLDIEGSDSLPFAWRMQASGDDVTITPGMVLLQGPNSYYGAPDPQNFVPVINGVALDADSPPVLPINSVGPTWVVLEVKIGKDGNPQGLPWAIKACSAQPADVALIRAFNDVLGQDGVINIPIALFQDGNQTVQVWLARPISVYWTYDTVLTA